MNITSKEIMIFAKEFDGKMHYRAGISTKNKNGTYDQAYIDVKMPKDTNIENKTKINITKGFLSFYKKKDGTDIWYIVVQEFTTQDKTETDVYAQFGKQTDAYVIEEIKAEQLDLPF